MSGEHDRKRFNPVKDMIASTLGNPDVIQLTNETPQELVSEIKYEMATQFDSISAGYSISSRGKDWSRSGFIDPETQGLMAKLIEKDDVVLDIAGGASPHAQKMFSLGAGHIYALDYSSELLKSGMRTLSLGQRDQLTLIAADMTKPIDFKDYGLTDGVDVAISTLAQLYTTDDQFLGVCRNVASVLKPDGKYFMTVPNIEAAAGVLGIKDYSHTYIVRRMLMDYAGTKLPTTFALRSPERYGDLAREEGLELVSKAYLKPNLIFYLGIQRFTDLVYGLGYQIAPPYVALTFKPI